MLTLYIIIGILTVIVPMKLSGMELIPKDSDIGFKVGAVCSYAWAVIIWPKYIGSFRAWIKKSKENTKKYWTEEMTKMKKEEP